MKAEQILYIRLPQQKRIVGQTRLVLGEIAELGGRSETCRKAAATLIREISADETGIERQWLLCFTEVARAVQEAHPELVPLCVGAEETILQYRPHEKKSSVLWERMKVAAVCLILFVGSMMAIMTFHTDAAVPEIFAEIHRLITGQEEARPRILILSYAVGIAVGILGFFNHIGRKKLTSDPTPVEIQFCQYEKQLADCVVESLDREGA